MPEEGGADAMKNGKNKVFRNIYSLFVYDLTNLFLTLQRTAMKEFINHKS